MREDLIKALLPIHGEPIDPHALARRDLNKAMPKRFYKQAEAQWRDGAWTLCLDGKPARTPGRNAVAVPSEAAGIAIAAEWQAQKEFILPSTMPVTRVVNSALDGVALEIEAVQAEIVKYSQTDLICYRNSDPASLEREQSAQWDPVLECFAEQLGARFVLSHGIVFVRQPAEAVAAVTSLVELVRKPLPLAALNVMTTLTGSALLSLAISRNWISAEEGWSKAHVDEDFQIRAWGADSDAQARRDHRWSEMQAAANLFAWTQPN